MKYLILTLILFVTIKSKACDCIVYADTHVKEYLKMVDMVFTGEVVSLIKADRNQMEIPEFLDTVPGMREYWYSTYPEQFYAKVLMSKNIKGETISSDTLFFVSEFTNCDPTYKLGQSYLFFADRNEDGQYMMVHCTPWGKLEDCSDIIERLTDKK